MQAVSLWIRHKSIFKLVSFGCHTVFPSLYPHTNRIVIVLHKRAFVDYLCGSVSFCRLCRLALPITLCNRFRSGLLIGQSTREKKSGTLTWSHSLVHFTDSGIFSHGGIRADWIMIDYGLRHNAYQSPTVTYAI